jgi:hypothetical protein
VCCGDRTGFTCQSSCTASADGGRTYQLCANTSECPTGDLCYGGGFGGGGGLKFCVQVPDGGGGPRDGGGNADSGGSSGGDAAAATDGPTE